jgi:hypothetical protein
MGLREGYDIILTRKLDLLHEAGYTRDLDIKQPADRALMRLFCLGNTFDADSADVFDVAFTARISEDDRRLLIHGLNTDGSMEEPAVQPTYAPAMLTKALKNTASGSQEEQIAVVTAMLRYLARCMDLQPANLERLRKGVTVIERDVKKLIPVLDSEEFRKNPNILDQETIPEDQEANMAPGYGEPRGWREMTTSQRD